MTDFIKIIACPSCAREIPIGSGTDLTRLKCPRCEAEIPEEMLRDQSELAEELAPGFRPGQRLSNYRIEALLGSGGMAVVFRGRQLSLNRPVAIKILPKDSVKKKMFVERFEGEAAALAALNHPNIVSVIDRGREGDTYFIVMEYVVGETLRDRLQKKSTLARDAIFPIVEQVLAGLAYAHRQGVIHRDIKPGNIIINVEGVIKIADFGLAHLAKARGGMDATRDNQAMGTLKYMAPEQLSSAKHVDGRADLYSLGVCVYEMLTGKLPLGAFKMPSEVDPTLDVGWDDIIQRVLCTDPKERYSSADEMLRSIKELQASPHLTQAEREQKEESEIVKPVSLTACSQCKAENPPSARQCEHCGVPLDDLFEKCPSCNQENRVDVSPCPACGTDMKAHREKMRHNAELIQAKAKQLAAERRFDDALNELHKLQNFLTREYAPVRASATLWIKRVKRRKAHFLRQSYEAGQRMIAEKRFDRAMEMWAVLPDSYECVGTRRKELSTQRQEAEAILKKGNCLCKEGNLEEAIKAWEKGAEFFAHDFVLRKRIIAARMRLGNQHLKETYLSDAKRARDIKNFSEALALCRKILDLDPDDRVAIGLQNEVEREQSEYLTRQARAAPEIILARPHPKEVQRVAPKTVGIAAGILGGVLVIALVVIFVGALMRGARGSASQELLAKANNLMATGEYVEASSLCDDISARFPNTPVAGEADTLATTMRSAIKTARDSCAAVQAIVERGDIESLIQGFRRFEHLKADENIKNIAYYRKYVVNSTEELRKKIGRLLAQEAALQEQRNEWAEALKLYKRATEEFLWTAEPVKSGLGRASVKVAEFEQARSSVLAAVEAGKWEDGLQFVYSALAVMPSNQEMIDQLNYIMSNMKPPEGMTLVPAGEYILSGDESRPARKVFIPLGFFMDRHEVTNARYGEFVRATGRPPPANWEGEWPPANRADMAVVNVTWEEASAFAVWRGCALPTEDQWECAARGKVGYVYPWGDGWRMAAVLAFSVQAPAMMPSDTSLLGCSDMAGNVAEWTASPVKQATSVPPGEVAAAEMETDTPLYIVKGSSWAGVEMGRPTRIVPADPMFVEGETEGRYPLVLTPLPDMRELWMRFDQDVQISYTGCVGTSERASLFARKWIPAWGDWAEVKLYVNAGDKIGGEQKVTVDAGLPSLQKVNVDFLTDCVAVSQQPNEWLEIRDALGIVRRLPYVRALQPRIVNIAQAQPALPLPEVRLEDTVRCSSRMVGRSDARYVNIGFRCVKVLWPPHVKKSE